MLPRLHFGILIWGFKCEKVTKLQKRVIRILSLSKYNAHSEPLIKKHKLLNICDILKLQELKFYYKYKTANYHNICNLYLSSKTQILMTMQLIYNYKGTYFTILSRKLQYCGLLYMYI